MHKNFWKNFGQKKGEIGIAKTFFFATKSKVGQHNNAKIINQVMVLWLILDYDTNETNTPFHTKYKIVQVMKVT